MYELRIERVFHAAHALRLYDGSMEDLHAHDWRVFVHVCSEKLDDIEVVMDFHELQKIVDEVILALDEQALNDLAMFKDVNPTAERVAEYIFKAIRPRMPENVRLARVTVTEAEGCRASFYES